MGVNLEGVTPSLRVLVDYKSGGERLLPWGFSHLSGFKDLAKMTGASLDMLLSWLLEAWTRQWLMSVVLNWG